MLSPSLLIAIPSLRGGPLLAKCLESLAHQTERDFEVIVIDNSGTGVIERQITGAFPSIELRVHRNPDNVGFGAAVNTAWSMSSARFLVTLNDDAEAQPDWLAALKRGVESSPDIGMCASQVRVYGTDLLDSAGMLLCPDGSSKQRGQGQSASRFDKREPVFFPSASAALYRREMLDDIGLFDAGFFLYCEDTDLGLRGRWNGWECLYVADAVVAHHYSQSSGAASPLKAWYIERNRLWVTAKTFPPNMLWKMPFHSALRYAWQLQSFITGKGTVSQFRTGGNGVLSLVRIVARAHWALLQHLPQLLRQRRAIRKSALINDKQFTALARRNAISAREIARL